VHTRTDGGYADLNLNYGEPGGGNASRQYFNVAGTTAVNDWANRMKSRYHALQVAVNRPFQNGFLLKGAYTLSRAKNMADEDGWVGLTWNHPAMYDQNFALAGFDRTHVFQMGFVWELPFLRETRGRAGRRARRLAGERHLRGLLRHAVLDRRLEPELNCPGCGSIFIDVSGTPDAGGQRRAPRPSRTTTGRSSRSRRAPRSRASATAGATRSAARRCGTSTSRRSRRSRSAASVRNSASRRSTSSTTELGCPGDGHPERSGS
jgi:hypothetical protein